MHSRHKCELLKQNRKMASAGLAAATPEAHIFSGNLSCILGLFTGWPRIELRATDPSKGPYRQREGPPVRGPKVVA